ncbi:LysR family transcriptional regulator [Myxococcus sp. K38C18041901]|uniref:LysR family transcriptional regulator n=1 Tax=Myxococcus guangdongensis TaxID=2906760 RepID=UPI0020A7373E|nr:LysR family transcriptional regulator [Myxococcus guangdongensis]MCP3063682.1 LysR family transcriptional regulator [Myxococcus guangdongensis]
MNATRVDENLGLFVAVARHLSFVEAAKQLGMSTSTVSRRIALLEETLGTRLLQRTSRHVGLTLEGTRLLERAGPLWDQLGAVLDQSVDREEAPAGRLRVTAPVTSGAQRIAPLLFSFAAQHPRVALELTLTNAVVDLVEEGFDLAFRVGPIRDAELVARRLWSIESVFAASPRFVRDTLKGQTQLTREALAKVPAVMAMPRGVWRLRRRDGGVEEVRPMEVRVAVNDTQVAVAAALAGLGVVSAARELVDPHGKKLVPLTVKGRTPEPRELFAVYPSRRQLSTRARRALDWVMEHGAPQSPRRPRSSPIHDHRDLALP